MHNDKILLERRKNLRKNETQAERVIWAILRKKKCKGYKFFRQYSVGSYILDFYCPKLKLAIELDGGHHNEAKQSNYDKERTAYLKGNGIKELRFWNNEVFDNLDGVYQIILENFN